MGSVRKQRRLCDIRLLRPMPATLLLTGYSGVARAQERALECVLDSDCAKGRCIDLVCVEQSAPPSGSAAPKAPLPEAPPKAETKPEAPPESTTTPQPEEQLGVRPEPAEERRAPRAIEVAPRPAARPRYASTEGDAGIDEETTRPRKVWYGIPLIATYAATEIVGAVTLSNESDATFLVLSLFSSPTVHWANRKVGKGFLSLLMQPVFAGAGALIFGSDRSSTGKSTWIAGAAVGFTGWAVIDIAAIAYKDAPKPKSASFEIVPFRVGGGGGAEVIGVW